MFATLAVLSGAGAGPTGSIDNPALESSSSDAVYYTEEAYEGYAFLAIEQATGIPRSAVTAGPVRYRRAPARACAAPPLLCRPPW